MDNKVEGEQIRPNGVDGIKELHDVPEQNIFADEQYIAEEKAGDHENRGHDAHNGAVRELLKRVKFLVGRRPERILLSLEDSPDVKFRLTENPFDIPSSQLVVAAQMIACKTVDQPEDTGGDHYPACVSMDDERSAVGRQARNPGHTKLDAGNKEQCDDKGVDPMPHPQRQGMEIGSFHRFTMARTAPCAITASTTTGRKIVPSRSIQLKVESGLEENTPGLVPPGDIRVPRLAFFR